MRCARPADLEGGVPVQKYFAALTILLMLGLVWVRVLLMRSKGIKAVHFGAVDKTDFLMPPLALFYFYVVFANAFNFPTVSRQEFFQSAVVAWSVYRGVGSPPWVPFFSLSCQGTAARQKRSHLPKPSLLHSQSWIRHAYRSAANQL